MRITFRSPAAAFPAAAEHLVEVGLVYVARLPAGSASIAVALPGVGRSLIGGHTDAE